MLKKNFLSECKNSSQFTYDIKSNNIKYNNTAKRLKINNKVLNSANFNCYADTIDVLQNHVLDCPPKSAQWLKRNKYKFADLP